MQRLPRFSKESCFVQHRALHREESQTTETEARRDDENFSYVAAWEYHGAGQSPRLHRKEINLTLKIWRQSGPEATGGLVTYHLNSISLDIDLDGELRPAGNGYDMGADEFDGVPVPPPATCKADLNNDGVVDGSDLALFAAEYGRTYCYNQ